MAANLGLGIGEMTGNLDALKAAQRELAMIQGLRGHAIAGTVGDLIKELKSPDAGMGDGIAALRKQFDDMLAEAAAAGAQRAEAVTQRMAKVQDGMGGTRTPSDRTFVTFSALAARMHHFGTFRENEGKQLDELVKLNKKQDRIEQAIRQIQPLAYE